MSPFFRLPISFFLLMLMLTFPLTVQAEASSPSLPAGLQYKKITTKAKQIVHLLEVDPNKINIVNLHAKNKTSGRKTVQALAIENNAIAGINGGFFNVDGSPSGNLKIQNRWYGDVKKYRATIGWSHGGKEALIDKIKIQKRKNRNQPEIMPFFHPETKKAWQQFENMVSGIPLLINNHKMVIFHYGEKFGQKFALERHARTAVGLLSNGHWIFAVVEKSEASGSPGMTIKEIASVMEKAGAKTALNLDGGGSSTLYIDRNIINNPQGDIDEDLGIRVERPVGDVILMLKR